MRKLLPFALLLGILFIAQTQTAFGCHKWVELVRDDGDGDGVIEVGENIVWLMHIGVSNMIMGDVLFTDVVVKDRLAAELEIDSIVPGYKGTVNYYYTGKSGKSSITIEWNVGTLGPGYEEAILSFYVSTDLNPSGKQEYTSPGHYELNSGPVMKFRVNGIQYSEEMPSIWIEVLP